ncbi:MAG: hypothetical protein ACXVEE_28505 [Polyangiales bacterium]
MTRRLKVLGAPASVALPRRKLFTVGKAEIIEPYGEVVALLSHVEDDLARYVLSSAPWTSWGRLSPAPFVFTLPSRKVCARDGVFLVTGVGEDRSEEHPDNKSRLHLVHLGQRAPLWSGPSRPHLYRLDALAS